MDRILLYSHKTNEDSSVLNCPKTDTEDDHPILRKEVEADHPILRKEVEATVQSLKKGNSAGVDNIPAGLVQAGEEDVITTLTTICNKIWQTGEWPTPLLVMSLVLGHNTSQERQPATAPELLNDQPHQPSKQSHAEDHIEQIEATSGYDNR